MAEKETRVVGRYRPSANTIDHAKGFERALENYEQHDVLSGAIPWPTWISAALVPFGCGVLVLRLALQLVGNVLSLVSGRDLYPLPPVTELPSARPLRSIPMTGMPARPVMLLTVVPLMWTSGE